MLLVIYSLLLLLLQYFPNSGQFITRRRVGNNNHRVEDSNALRFIQPGCSSTKVHFVSRNEKRDALCSEGIVQCKFI
jgi:hypothetical protein